MLRLRLRSALARVVAQRGLSVSASLHLRSFLPPPLPLSRAPALTARAAARLLSPRACSPRRRATRRAP